MSTSFLRNFPRCTSEVIHKIEGLHRGLIKISKIFIRQIDFSKSLNLKANFFADVVSNLLKAASNQGFWDVKRHLSTKLSTAFVDRFKTAFESDGYASS